MHVFRYTHPSDFSINHLGKCDGMEVIKMLTYMWWENLNKNKNSGEDLLFHYLVPFSLGESLQLKGFMSKKGYCQMEVIIP